MASNNLSLSGKDTFGSTTLTSEKSPPPPGDDSLNLFTSGGYVYAILVISLLVALVYFFRVLLAKRQARLQAQKDPDCEGFNSNPPTYNNHMDDLQVVEAQPRNIVDFSIQQQRHHRSHSHSQLPYHFHIRSQQHHQQEQHSGRTVSTLTLPRTAVIRGETYYIVTPRTHVSRPHRTSSRNPHLLPPDNVLLNEPAPPAYEDLGVPSAPSSLSTSSLLAETPSLAPSASAPRIMPLTGAAEALAPASKTTGAESS